jgi:hypothetical protein
VFSAIGFCPNKPPVEAEVGPPKRGCAGAFAVYPIGFDEPEMFPKLNKAGAFVGFPGNATE